jgi:16S rRNA processing protein RimM
LGLIGQPFNLDGTVKIKPFSGDINNLLRFREVMIRRNGSEKKLIVRSSSAIPPFVIMRFDGYSTPEAARTICGWELIANRSDASPLAPGEFYIEDIKGMTVEAEYSQGCPASALNAPPGNIIGYITDIVEGGGGELAEIKLPDGKIKLVPFRKEFFPIIDTENGKAVLTNLWILE